MNLALSFVRVESNSFVLVTGLVSSAAFTVLLVATRTSDGNADVVRQWLKGWFPYLYYGWQRERWTKLDVDEAETGLGLGKNRVQGPAFSKLLFCSS